MAYNHFSLDDIRAQFVLTIETKKRSLFHQAIPIIPSLTLTNTLRDYTSLATSINTEKARSEMIVAPILMEFWRLMDGQAALFSGADFPVDAEQGLNGSVDFMLCASPNQLAIAAPAVVIVEAKRDNIHNGLGQCAATMLAARKFNQQHNHPVETIYGAVTTGSVWQFLMLADNTLHIDRDEYYANQVDKILGILMSMVAPLGITMASKEGG